MESLFKAATKTFTAIDREELAAARSMDNLIHTYKGMLVFLHTTGTLLATSSPREEGLSRLPRSVAKPNTPGHATTQS